MLQFFGDNPQTHSHFSDLFRLAVLWKYGNLRWNTQINKKKEKVASQGQTGVKKRPPPPLAQHHLKFIFIQKIKTYFTFKC
jgi:hypothetical protein